MSTNFDVVLTNKIDSKTARVGQPVNARLVQAVHSGSKLIAPEGSEVTGHVTSVYGSRRMLHAEVSTKRWMRASGGLGLSFDRIVTPEGTAVKIKAIPVSIVQQHGHQHREKDSAKVNVSKSGTIEASRKRDLRPKAARTALGVAAFIAGPVTAVAGAAVGAVRPTTVLPANVDGTPQKHQRLKGMTTGFVAGLPGGFLVNDAVIKGQQVVLTPGTHLKLQWNH